MVIYIMYVTHLLAFYALGHLFSNADAIYIIIHINIGSHSWSVFSIFIIYQNSPSLDY